MLLQKTKLLRVKIKSKILPIITGIIVFSLIVATCIPRGVYAADFDMEISRIYSVDSSEQTLLHIQEKRVIKNNSRTHYIPSSSKETFIIQNFKEGLEEDELEIKKSSIEVTNQYGIDLTYTIKQENNDIFVEVNYSSDLYTGSTQTFILEYDSNELIEKLGKVTNIYIPGLNQDYEEITNSTNEDGSTTSTQILYTTALEVPNSLGEQAFTLPKPYKTSESLGKTTFEFKTSDIIGKTVWQQIGTEQIYHFKITQPTAETDHFIPDQLNFLSKNTYTLVLPREYAETNQKVFFSNISPKPQKIRIDNEGNVLAEFLVDATKKANIVVEGYITTSLNSSNNRNNIPSDKTLSDLSEYSEMSKYLKPSEYWESENEEIVAKARELAGTETNILEILKTDYEFIVDSIDYDNFKYGSQNDRKGALETLRGGDSVCMEYSDLLIALLRAQDIPARAAYGYGYDPTQQPENQESHQWVQAWIPDYGWLTLDPTWGETGRQFIGRDLDHALWYVAGKHPDEPSPLEVTTTSIEFELDPSMIEITAIEEIPTEGGLQTLDELIDEIGSSSSTTEKVSRLIQTTAIGKALIILTPVCSLILIIMFLIGVFSRIARRPRTQRPTESPTSNRDPQIS
ncbi:transglutaminase domain-containing protein [Candidatus Dojkabacteria bacterium]|nr:transglutaminase domain-containing protein [Candidatus Dojkabacteria bacterium]